MLPIIRSRYLVTAETASSKINISGQSYKASRIVIYKSRGVLTKKLPKIRLQTRNLWSKRLYKIGRGISPKTICATIVNYISRAVQATNFSSLRLQSRKLRSYSGFKIGHWSVANLIKASTIVIYKYGVINISNLSSKYDSSVVIYARRGFIRLATGMIYQSLSLDCVNCCHFC